MGHNGAWAKEHTRMGRFVHRAIHDIAPPYTAEMTHEAAKRRAEPDT